MHFTKYENMKDLCQMHSSVNRRIKRKSTPSVSLSTRSSKQHIFLVKCHYG